MLRLTVRWPDGNKATFRVDKKEDVFLGRVPSINDICIQDPSVSRKHAHIKFREEGPTIYDLKSRNGLLLNGARVSRAVLKDGDELVLGKVLIEVSFCSTPSENLDEIEKYEETAVETRSPDAGATEFSDRDEEKSS